MATFLFNEIIFGPVASRRLGISLGVNLLPVDKKYCNFDCLYCECGWTCNDKVKVSELPSRINIKKMLTEKIQSMDPLPDVITFAGNGEPTIHPEFSEIIQDTIEVRNNYCQNARIAVLSNSTTLHKHKVVEALKQIDQPILKLDSAIEDSYRFINRPGSNEPVSSIISNLSKFGDGLILQTLFFKGVYKGIRIDNSAEIELESLLNAYKKISPEKIMIYTFERDTALDGLSKISLDRLKEIGKKIEALGIPVEISG